MKIKALAAIAALFFATSTFAQVAEPTATSPTTTIPSKGQTQTPADNGGAAKSKGKKNRPAGGHVDNGQHKGDKKHSPANPDGKRRHDESEAHTTGQAENKDKKEQTEGENHEDHGKKSKAKHAEGQNGQAKKAENAQNEQKSMRDRKTKKNTSTQSN